MKKLVCGIIVLFMFTACGGGGGDGGGASDEIIKIICEVRNATSDYDIYIMNEDGSEIQNLTNTPSQKERAPRWSPDGTKIYFQKEEFTNQYYLYSMYNNGRSQTKISNTLVKDFQFDISPDGSKIAFVGTTQYDIYVVNVDGTGLTQLTANAQYDMCPSWSPDGNWIAFVSNRDGAYKLYKMKADGTEQSAISTCTDLLDYQPQWSPDGTKIAFTRWEKFWGTTDNAELFIIKNDGTNLVNISNNSSDDWYPVWSHNGLSIIFMSNRDSNREIYLWRNNTVANITNYTGAADENHSFSPDGSKIIFTSTRDSSNQQIYIMNADGTNQTRLTFDTTLIFYSPRMGTVIE